MGSNVRVAAAVVAALSVGLVAGCSRSGANAAPTPTNSSVLVNTPGGSPSATGNQTITIPAGNCTHYTKDQAAKLIGVINSTIAPPIPDSGGGRLVDRCSYTHQTVLNGEAIAYGIIQFDSISAAQAGVSAGEKELYAKQSIHDVAPFTVAGAPARLKTGVFTVTDPITEHFAIIGWPVGRYAIYAVGATTTGDQARAEAIATSVYQVLAGETSG